jgi:hypothetical protein
MKLSITPETVAPPAEDALLLQAVRRLNGTILGLVLGLVCGGLLFAATLWLVAKGGPVVGPHLALLGQFFPGYRVTLGGSVLGFLYGFATGFVAGWVIGAVYNAVVAVRHRSAT